jgi:hypothetical protein
MLSKIPFYHGTTKRMVIAVGSLFSNIFCVAKDEKKGTQKIVNVPLAYANKEKFIVRLQQDPRLNEDVQIVLPRMSYEIVGMDYDEARQLNKVNKVMSVRDGRSTYTYSPVPYTLTFNLYSFTRTVDDNLQIMEQIVPYFTPDINLSIKIMQNPDVIQDCAFILSSVNTDDQYDGGFEDRRYIITTYSFQLKMNFFGPISGIIDPENHFASGPKISVIKKVSVNVNTNKYSAVIDPFDATAIDPYVVDEDWATRVSETDFDVGKTL